MDSRHAGIQGYNLKTAEGLLQPTATPPAPGWVGFDFDAEPQFGKRDGTGRYRFRRPGSESG